MSVNKNQPHLLVLPEDDANRQLAVGFHIKIGGSRQMQVLPVAGGWRRVLDEFNKDHVKEMQRCPHRRMILLIDFDEDDSRAGLVRSIIPPELANRVFVLGAWSEPEELKSRFGTYESIGAELAAECQKNQLQKYWIDDLLKHNLDEVQRLRDSVCSILFPGQV